MEAFLKDLRQSVRILQQNLGFTITAVAALALGIGGNTAIFSIVNAVLLRPLPYPEPDRVVIFMSPQGSRIAAASVIRFNVWREQTSVFQDVTAYRYGRVNMTGTNHTEEIQSAFVSSNYFRLFGQVVVRGRAFTAGEDRPGGGDVVILSDAFWRRAFGSDPGILGRTIPLSGRPYEVIGIMAGVETEAPATFDAASAKDPIDIWVPFQIDPNSNDQNGYFNAAARLKPGVALSTAEAQLQLATHEFRRRFPADDLPPRSVFSVQPMREVLVRGERSTLSLLSGAVAFVLLIACTNVANLLLIRATGRKREIAIRAAVGAGRGRIIRQLLTESVLLSVIGGAFGLLLGMVGIRVLMALNTVRYARLGEHGLVVTADWRVLSFTIVVSLTTGILFGLIPALQVSRGDLAEALKESGGHTGPGLRRNTGRSLLVISEVTLALVLLIAAGLLIRDVMALRSVNPGFDAHGVLTMRVSLTAPQFQKTAAIAELARESIQNISALPGAAAAAFTCSLPLEDRTVGGVVVVGRPLQGRTHGAVNITTITPGYFEVFKIPILRGRAFTEADRSGTAPVVIIGASMARRFWPKDDPLSSALKDSLIFPELPGKPWQIVGIAGDVRADGLGSDAPPIVYFSVAQAPDDLSAYLVHFPVTWIVRTHGLPYSLRLPIQNALHQASTGLPLPNVLAMEEVLRRSIAGREFNMMLLSIFGVSALLLAAIGIYGVMANSVQQRTREIGIRMAVGAGSSQIQSMVVLEGMRLALIGVVIGIAGAFGVTRFIASFFFGAKASDTAVFTAAPALLGSVALLAVWRPARRASLINPIDALRHE